MKNIRINQRPSSIVCLETHEGETIEKKVGRMVQNGEPVTDNSPLIYTERKDGVLPAYNIRADRWAIAIDATDKITASNIAKKAESQKATEEEDGKPESTEGTK